MILRQELVIIFMGILEIVMLVLKQLIVYFGCNFLLKLWGIFNQIKKEFICFFVIMWVVFIMKWKKNLK